jgi:hypothetical protein
MKTQLSWTRHPFGLAAALAVAILAVASAWTAIGVRDCPEGRPCTWDPWLGIAAATVGALALLACIRLLIWSRHDRGGFEAAMISGAAVIGGFLWCVAFLAALRP